MTRICVIVSFWNGRSSKCLDLLLTQMTRIDAGVGFDLVVVCNGGDLQPLHLSSKFESLKPRILNRENTGYNIGAWNHGWKLNQDYDYYLFLQDETFIKRKHWVSEYVYRMSGDAGVGLLGESIMWDRMTWKYIREATDRDLGTGWYDAAGGHPIDIHLSFMASRGIEPGPVGTHLQSLVLFSSGKVLKELGGFPVGGTYHEAVGSEIGISRLVESKGYRVSKIKDDPFSLIGHRQWTPANQFRMKLRNGVVAALRSVGLKRG